MRERLILFVLSAIVVVIFFVDPGIILGFRRYVSSVQPAPNAAVIDQESQKAREVIIAYIQKELGNPVSDTVRASVFSNYPFNFKSELVVDAGSDAGIVAGQVAILPSGSIPRSGILIGRVERVYKDASTIKTIFDAGWNSEVRIGDAGTEALLTGGLEPELSLIPKDANVVSGDIVYNTDPQFPFGLAIGRIKDVQVASDKTFKKATLRFAYDMNELRALVIIKDHEEPSGKKK